MTKIGMRTIVAALSALSIPLLPTATLAADGLEHAQRWQLNMPYGVTPTSHVVYDLHMLIFWICVVVAVLVYGVMFYSMAVHRKSRGAKPAQFSHNTRLEVLWTALASLVLVAMAWPATAVMINMYDASDSQIDILVTGYQWKWKYEYLGEDVSFFSNIATPDDEIYGDAPKGEHYLLNVDKPLVIPVGTKVRFLITAADVLHSWWVPDFAVKMDAIPGFVNEAWTWVEREGVYRGQCTELCGRLHGFMPIVVNATSQNAYRRWLGERHAEAAAERALLNQRMDLSQLMERGKQVYQTNCASCHLATGAGLPGAFPALHKDSAATGALAEHLGIVINGTPGTAMAAFGAQLGAADLAAVITYERNAWGNDTGDLVQPIDVERYRRGDGVQ